MFCNRCGVQADVAQASCTECGALLDAPNEPTQPIDAITDNAATSDPPGEPTQPIDAISDDLEDGEPEVDDHRDVDRDVDRDDHVDEVPPPPPLPLPPPVPPAPPQLYDLALDEPDLLHDPPRDPATTETLSPTAGASGVATSQMPTADLAHPGPLLDDADDGLFSRFRIGVVSGLGLVTGMAALFGMLTRVVAIRTDARAPAFATGDWLVADLGTNLPGAMIVALVVLLAGVIGAGFRARWGAGLAGGAGLAIAGWVALTIGLSERPLEVAIDVVSRPTTEAFTVTITRDVGYWVLLAAGVLGLLTFAVSLGSAGRDHRRGLNPWIASLGAVAAVIAAAGPLIPQGSATIDDNWSPGSGGLGLPTWFVVGRLVQLGLLAYAGVIGFLLVRRYGLALAIGGMTVSVWLAVSTLLGLGDDPVGPGYANPGAGAAPLELHSVTIVGMIGLVGFAVVAVIAAFDQAAREY